jgi:amino-acid N-acetyltransferase
VWEDLAEIRSLAVDPCCRDLGVGRALVESCLEEARSLRLRRVFALTYQEDFFRRLGFGAVDKSTLPQKVWGDCMRCTKFPDCDETAVLMELPGG